jgi:hypothetical protein
LELPFLDHGDEHVPQLRMERHRRLTNECRDGPRGRHGATL